MASRRRPRFAPSRSSSEVPDPRVAACRRLVSRKALLGAGLSLIPIPGLDIAADAALLARLIHEINLRFGLSPEQIEALSPSRQALVYKAIRFVGAALVGQAVKRGLLLAALRGVGLRLTTGQAARVIPVVGNVLTASAAYLAMRRMLFSHIDDCARVSAQIALLSSSESPAPD